MAETKEGSSGGSEMSLKDQGNEFFKSGKYLKAAALYTQAIKQDPSNPTLYRYPFLPSFKFPTFFLLGNIFDFIQLLGFQYFAPIFASALWFSVFLWFILCTCVLKTKSQVGNLSFQFFSASLLSL